MATNTKLTINPKTPLYGQCVDYLRWCRYTRGMTEVTIASKIWIFNKFYEDTGCKDITKLSNGLFTEWAESREKEGAGPVSRNRARTNLKCFVDYHREMGLTIPIKFTLIKRIREDPEPQFFCSKKDVDRAIKLAEKTNAQTGLMIRIAFDTALRASELMRLRVCEVKGQQLDFLAKGRITRHTFIKRETAKLLKAYIEKNGIEDYLWPGNCDGHLAYNTLRRQIEKPFKELGLEGFHPHSLRHSCVADLEERGATVEEIYAFLGHRNLKSTQHYLHRIHEADTLLRIHKKYHKF